MSQLFIDFLQDFDEDESDVDVHSTYENTTTKHTSNSINNDYTNTILCRNLPHDLLIRCFSYIHDFKTLSNISLTCKLFLQLVEKIPFWHETDNINRYINPHSANNVAIGINLTTKNESNNSGIITTTASTNTIMNEHNNTSSVHTSETLSSSSSILPYTIIRSTAELAHHWILGRHQSLYHEDSVYQAHVNTLTNTNSNSNSNDNSDNNDNSNIQYGEETSPLLSTIYTALNSGDILEDIPLQQDILYSLSPMENITAIIPTIINDNDNSDNSNSNDNMNIKFSNITTNKTITSSNSSSNSSSSGKINTCTSMKSTAAWSWCLGYQPLKHFDIYSSNTNSSGISSSSMNQTSNTLFPSSKNSLYFHSLQSHTLFRYKIKYYLHHNRDKWLTYHCGWARIQAHIYPILYDLWSTELVSCIPMILNRYSNALVPDIGDMLHSNDITRHVLSTFPVYNGDDIQSHRQSTRQKVHVPIHSRKRKLDDFDDSTGDGCYQPKKYIRHKTKKNVPKEIQTEVMENERLLLSDVQCIDITDDCKNDISPHFISTNKVNRDYNSSDKKNEIFVSSECHNDMLQQRYDSSQHVIYSKALKYLVKFDWIMTYESYIEEINIQAQALCKDIVHIWECYQLQQPVIMNDLYIQRSQDENINTNVHVHVREKDFINAPLGIQGAHSIDHIYRCIFFITLLIRSCTVFLTWCMELDDISWCLNDCLCPENRHYYKLRQFYYRILSQRYISNKLMTSTTSMTRNVPKCVTQRDSKQSHYKKRKKGSTYTCRDIHIHTHDYEEEYGKCTTDKDITQQQQQHQQQSLLSLSEIGIVAVRAYTLLHPIMSEILITCMMTLINILEYEDNRVHMTRSRSYSESSKYSTRTGYTDISHTTTETEEKLSPISKDTNVQHCDVYGDSTRNTSKELTATTTTTNTTTNTQNAVMKGVMLPKISDDVINDITQTLLQFKEFLHIILCIPDTQMVTTRCTVPLLHKKYMTPLMQNQHFIAYIREHDISMYTGNNNNDDEDFE